MDKFNSLTGRSGRRNRALRDVTDWAENIGEFLSRYNLQKESTGFNSILENIGEVKFDLTTITYRTREIIKKAKNVEGTSLSPLMEEVLHDLEAIRRALINPALSSTAIRNLIPNLCESFARLQAAISVIEYK